MDLILFPIFKEEKEKKKEKAMVEYHTINNSLLNLRENIPVFLCEKLWLRG